MTRLTIDQILQATTPARSSADPSNSATAKGRQFEEHLQRAATLEKPASPSEPQEDHVDEGESDLALATGQEQDTPREHVEATTPPIEGEDSMEPVPAETEILIATDDIAISSEAMVAIEQIDADEINAETQVLSTQIAPPVDAGGNPESDSESTPFPSDPIEDPSNSPQSHELATPGPDEEPLLNIGDPQQTTSPATSTTASVVQTPDEAQQSPQESLPTATENTSTQGLPATTSQPLKSHDTALQPIPLNEAEQNTTASGSEPKAKEPGTSEPLFQQESPLKELTAIRSDIEPTQTSNTAAADTTTTIETNTTNESTVAPSKSTDTTSTNPASTDAHTETDPVPTSDRAKFVQRVSGALRAARDQNGLVQLKLSPPELGSLRIEITVNQGALTAQVETESAAARNILLDNLPALRERLAEQEIRIEKFNVDVRDEGSQQQENPGTENRRSGNNTSDKAPTRNGSSNKESSSLPDSSGITRPTSDLSAGLDVMI